MVTGCMHPVKSIILHEPRVMHNKKKLLGYKNNDPLLSVKNELTINLALKQKTKTTMYRDENPEGLDDVVVDC